MDALSLFNSSLSGSEDSQKNSGSGDVGNFFCALLFGEESLLPAAVNNYAICALYLRRIPIAISRLENLILEDPVRYMTDPVVFNLCTLYDLSCAPDTSTTKKKVLQRVASIFHIDDPMLHWRSFRLN
jgi:hypothetical protein